MPLRETQVRAAIRAGWGAGDEILANLASVRSRWPERWRAAALYYISIAGSTNDEAWALARAGAPDGTAVIAEEQSSGRGRRGRRWFSPAGGLWMSVVLRPQTDVSASAALTIACALAAARAAGKCTALRLGLKWPNDIMLMGKKAGGILVETRTEGTMVTAAVAGLGLNVNQPAAAFPEEIRATATSLSQYAGQEIGLAGLAGGFLLELEEYLRRLAAAADAGGAAWLAEEYRALDVLPGKMVRVQQGGRVIEGLCLGVDGRGFLAVRGAEMKPQAIGWCDSVTVLEDVGR